MSSEATEQRPWRGMQNDPERQRDMAQSISVIVPLFNEAENVGPLCERLTGVLRQLGRPWELILVNDGSTDETRQRLCQWEETEENIRALHLRRNYGQTAAMMAGLDHARGEILVPIDGDLQNDPADIPRLLAKLDEGYDVVSGWRRSRKDHALRRNLPSRIANRLISWVSGVRLHDYGCSLKAYRRSVLDGVRLYGEMHRFVPIYASWQGARITEIPVSHSPRLHGKSKYGMERVLKVLLDLLVVKFLSLYAEKPMYVFGSAGILSLLVGGCAGLYAVYLKLFEGVSFVSTPLPLLVVMTTLMGIIFFMMGLLAELIIRIYYESQSKRIYTLSGRRRAD